MNLPLGIINEMNEESFTSRIAVFETPPPRQTRPAAFFIKRGSENLVISLPSSNGEGVLGQLTDKVPDVDHLFLSCGDQAWMTQGVPLITNNLQQTVALIREQIGVYKKVMLMGSSCGGYLALTLGLLARVHSIISFDPHLFPISGARRWIDPTQWVDALDMVRENAERPGPFIFVYHGSSPEDWRKAVELEKTGYGLTRKIVPNSPTHGRALRVWYEGEGNEFRRVVELAFAQERNPIEPE